MRGITRRAFMAGTAAIGAALPLRGLRAGGPPAAPTPDLVDVGGKVAGAMVAAALEALGGIRRFVKPGDDVVLKPNLGFANPPEWGSTTNPDVILAVARACLDAGAGRVTVVEHPIASPDRALERTGLKAALAALPALKVSLIGAPSDFRKVAIRGGTALKSVEVARAVLAADVLINLPVAKSHGSAGVSFGMKNAMGVIRDRRIFHGKLDLHRAIADLARVIRPQLTILDATRALVTNGPAGPGETVELGRVVAGPNVVSVDAYALGLTRWNGKALTVADAPFLQRAAHARLGAIDPARLLVRRLDV